MHYFIRLAFLTAVLLLGISWAFLGCGGSGADPGNPQSAGASAQAIPRGPADAKAPGIAATSAAPTAIRALAAQAPTTDEQRASPRGPSNLSPAPTGATPSPPPAGEGSPPLEGRRFALVIGVNDYAYITKLHRAVKDARELAASLENLGYQVVLMTDESPRKPLTAEDIRSALDGLAAQTGPNDTILFYFSGHGFSMGQGDASLDCICPTLMARNNPNTGFPLLAARSILVGPRCRARYKLLLVDACRSTGGGLEHPFTPPRDNPPGFALLYSTTPGSVSKEFGPGATSGGLVDQDGDTVDNGIFTHFLKKALAGSGDTDRDGLISFRELGKYVAGKMMDLSWSRTEAYQIPYWDQGIVENEIPIAVIRAILAPPCPKDAPCDLVAQSLQRPPNELPRFLLDRLLADGRYHGDSPYQAECNRAIGEALRRRFEGGLAVALERQQFTALLEVVFNLDGAIGPTLGHLAVGARPDELVPRLRGLVLLLEAAKNSTAQERRQEVEVLVSGFLAPYCRRAIDVQNEEVLKLVYLERYFPVDDRLVSELNEGLRRMLNMNRPDWAERLYSTFEGKVAGLCPPPAMAVARLTASLDAERWPVVQHLLECLKPERPSQELLEPFSRWLVARLEAAPAPTAQLKASISRLRELSKSLEAINEEVRRQMLAYIGKRLAALHQAAEVAQLAEWHEVASTSGIPTEEWTAALRPHLDRLRQLVSTGLPPVGEIPRASFDVRKAVDLLVGLEPALRDSFRTLFLGRARSALKELPLQHARYLPEYDFARHLGLEKEQVAAEVAAGVLASGRDQKTLPGALARVLVELLKLFAPAPSLEEGLQQVTRRALEDDDIEAFRELAVYRPAVDSVEPIVDAHFREQLAGPSETRDGSGRLLKAAESVGVLRQMLGGEEPLEGAVAAVWPALRRVLERGDLVLAEALRAYEIAKQLTKLSPGDESMCLSRIVALMEESDPELCGRVEELLAVSSRDPLPAPTAARVFACFYLKEDWDRAAEWIAPGGAAVAQDRVARVQRIRAFRDRIARWKGLRAPAVKKWAAGKRGGGARPEAYRFELRLDSVDGFAVTGVIIGPENRELCGVSGKVGEEWLELKTTLPPRGGNAAQHLFETVRCAPSPRAFEEIPLLVGRGNAADGNGNENAGGVSLTLGDPTAGSVLLDSLVPNHRAFAYRDSGGGPWPSIRGGSAELLFPIFLRGPSKLSWQVGPLFEKRGGRLEGTLLIEGVAGVNLQGWKPSQNSKLLRNRLRLLVTIETGAGSTTEAVAVPSDGRETRFSIPCPRGTTQIGLDPEGVLPKPFLVCEGVRTVLDGAGSAR